MNQLFLYPTQQVRKNTKCQPMDECQLRKIFGTETILSIEWMRGFVKPSGASATCMYEIPDYASTGAAAISRATGNGYDSKVQVVYDSTGADLYSIDGRFIMTCPPVVKASSSYIEATEEQKAAREHLRKRKEADREAPHRALDELIRTSEYMNGYGYNEAVQLGLRKPDINEAYENSIAMSSDDKKLIERRRRSLERKEQREAAESQAEYRAAIEEGYMARQWRKFRENQSASK